MPRYRYAGPAPAEDPGSGELVRPLDVRESGTEPDWGLWELLDEPEASPPPPDDPPADETTPPANPEGM